MISSRVPVSSMTAQSRLPCVGEINMVGAHRSATPLMPTSTRVQFADANSMVSTHTGLTDDAEPNVITDAHVQFADVTLPASTVHLRVELIALLSLAESQSLIHTYKLTLT